MIQINNKKDCCGCEGCYNICPMSCISMQYDEEGFKFPVVDETRCINCKQCERVCPIINGRYETNNNNEGYAAINCNEEIRLNSSSGGIFYQFAKKIIDLGGVVVGAVMSNDCKEANHIFVDNKNDLSSLLGSKYLQSNIGKTFQKIKISLNNNKLVLFSGTPCQVGALNNYLGKEYDNLICIDLICHGVPSPGLWKKNIEYIEKELHTKIENVNFRCKKDNCAFGKTNDYQNLYFIPKEEDMYFRLFLSDYSLRLSCYDCKFKGISRNSDITLGDFWGINDFLPEMEDGKGVSLVIIHSEKGKRIFEKIRSHLKIEKIDTEKVFEHHNDAMTKSAILPIHREQFWKDYQRLNINKLGNKYVPLTMKEKIKKVLRELGLLEVIKKHKGVKTSNSSGMLYIMKK